jgi:Tol biopolymer transport system component
MTALLINLLRLRAILICSLMSVLAATLLFPTGAEGASPNACAAIAFDARQSAQFPVMLMDPQGGHQYVEYKKGLNREASWSPDGQHLVFVHHSGTSNGIYIISKDGLNLCKVVATNQDQFVAPMWSPVTIQNKFWIVYSDSPVPTTNAMDRDLFLVPASCSAGIKFQLTNTPTENERFPTWSPDGTKIAAEKIYMPGSADVLYWPLTISSDLTSATLGTATNLTDSNSAIQQSEAPNWARSGNLITFSAEDAGGTSIHVWTVDFGGTSPVFNRITNVANIDFRPIWSPDNSHIVFTRGAPGSGSGIYVVKATDRDVSGSAVLTTSQGFLSLNASDWRRFSAPCQ